LELIASPSGHPLASGVTEASILRAAAEIGAIYVNKKVGDFSRLNYFKNLFSFDSKVAEESQTRTSFY